MAAPGRAGGWYLYRFRTDYRCPCGRPHPLYGGKSNDPLRRVNEHMKGQWWRPMVAGWDILPGTYATEAEVLTAEREMIRRDRPFANDQHNGANPCRLLGLPAGYAPGVGAPVVRAPKPTALPRRSRRPATGRGRRSRKGAVEAAGPAVLWLTLTVGLWLAEVRWLHRQIPASRAPWLAAVGAAAVVGWVWVEQRPRKRRGPAAVAVVALALGWAALRYGAR